MPTLKDWIKATRVQTAAVTMLALWVGHIVIEPLNAVSAITLGFIGLGIHVWGFTLNEVYDAEYDKKFGKDTGHPIANDVIDADKAKVIAWIAGATALLLYMILVTRPLGIIALVLSFAHGYIYNVRSKKDWYSNVYLSAWVFLVVVAGALSAGNFQGSILVVGGILSIQIFVQVIEGDLKDISGPENTFAEHFGVSVDKDSGNVKYPPTFVVALVFWKGIEAIMILWLILQTNSLSGILDILQVVLYMSVSFAFIYTLNGWLVGKLDRNKIKEESSKHEIVSILLLGVGLMGFDIYGSVLVGLIPIVWYLVVNSIIHRKALNPDI